MPSHRAEFLKSAIIAARLCRDNAAFQYDNEKVAGFHMELLTERFHGKVSVGTVGKDYRFTVSVDGDQTHSSQLGTWDQGLEWMTAMQHKYEQTSAGAVG